MAEAPSVGRYLLFGVCAGLGLLSRYNYSLWLVGLILAALSLRAFRSTILDRRFILVLLVCGLIFLPNGLWILHHQDLAFASASKFDLEESASWLNAIGTGFRNIASAAASYLGPLGLVYLLVFVKAPRVSICPAATEYQRLLTRTLLLIGGSLILLIVSFRATGLRERWLQPILVCLPVLGAVLVRGRIDQLRVKVMAGIGLVIMLAVCVIMPGRILLAERLHREEPLNRPYAELAHQIQPLANKPTLIVARSSLLAGNFRLALPDTAVVTPELAGLFPERPPHQLLVWDASRRTIPPDSLIKWASQFIGADQEQSPRFFTATYKFHRTKQMTLGLLEIEPHHVSRSPAADHAP